MKDFSYITSSSPAFIESLYQDFVKDPASVDPELRKFFEGFDFAVDKVPANGQASAAGTQASTQGTQSSGAQSTGYQSTRLGGQIR